MKAYDICALHPTQQLSHMEMGLEFKVSVERLKKAWVKLAVPGLQSKWLDLYTTDIYSKFGFSS